jgi:hypothetical protein
MSSRKLSLIAPAVLVVLLISTSAHALSPRIFMSTNGNNANDCANPATPCLTFAGAIAQVNPGGEVIAQATGGYGPISITGPIVLNGPAGVIVYSGASVSINAPGATVVLHGLTIDGAGVGTTGIAVTSVGTLVVDNCLIIGFNDGIDVTQGYHLSLLNSTISGCPGSGISANNGTVDAVGSRFIGDGSGLNVNAASGDTTATVRECTFIYNSDGIDASANSGRTASIDISHSTFTHNGIAIRPSNNFGSAPVRLAFSTVTANNIGVQPANSGTFFTQGNNLIRDNPNGDIAPQTGGTSAPITGD